MLLRRWRCNGLPYFPPVGVRWRVRRTLFVRGNKEWSSTSAFTVTDEATDFVFWCGSTKRGTRTQSFLAKEVPAAECERVKTMKPGTDDGAHGDYVFVANLCSNSPSGAYDVRVIYACNVRTRASSAPTKAGTHSCQRRTRKRERGNPTLTKQTHVDVVIYGASWCSACHTAQIFTKERNSVRRKGHRARAAAAMETKRNFARTALREGAFPSSTCGAP